MKQSVSIYFLLIFTVVLAAKEGQAKKGCSYYGHSCYGGHGKRSLNVQDEARPEAIMQAYPSEERDMDSYPRYRLINILRSLYQANLRRPSSIERAVDTDYPQSSENFKENAAVYRN